MIIISSPTGPIEVVSGALERITGSRVADLGGARSSVHPDDLDGVRVSYGKAMSRPREPVPISARVRSTSGEWRRLEGTFTNLLDDPSVGGVVMNAHDVTDRVDLEDKLRHSEKIDELGRLAGAVAHDFRNVSFAIRSFAQFALARVERGDDVSAELREILRGCEHADGLVSQLLSFGRPEPASAAAVDPGAALEELQPTLRRLVPPWVRLEVSCAPSLPLVLVSQTQLEQIVLNLVTNAVDAMTEGGALTLAFEAEPSAVRIVVTDTGIGMDDETRKQIFQPFFTTKGDGAGNGLGLSIVSAIASAAEGHVEVESTPGAGRALRRDAARA